MVRFKATSFVDNIGNPEPAALVNDLGVLATAAEAVGASGWYIAAQVPLDPYVQFLIDGDDVLTTVLSLSMGARCSGLLVALQMGDWQYRLVLPLLGPTIEAYLHGMDRKAPTIIIELFAQEIASHSRRFAVPVQDGQHAEAIQSLSQTFPKDVGDLRRDIGQMCLSAAVPELIPPSRGWTFASTTTLARVWPPELLAMRHDKGIPAGGRGNKG